MMRSYSPCGWALLLATLVLQQQQPAVVVSAAASSWNRDVVRRTNALRSKQQLDSDINNELLSKAMPIKEYEAMLAEYGLSTTTTTTSTPNNRQDERSSRFLEDEDNNNGNADDDFFDNQDNYDMYSYSGYSIKYAKCQPVQYFSENAIRAGEHSPMITEDIVVLRLCPYKTCTSSRTFGCHYNFAEYALTASDYVRIMLKYSALKRDYLCQWCEDCEGRRQRRKLEDDGDSEEDDDGGNNQYNYNYQGDCDSYNDYCYDYDNECGDGDQDDDNNYLDFEGYQDYLDCSQVDYNDYAYFIRPRCDGSEQTLKMAVYYDNYCVQYAGDDVSVKNFGLGFKEGMFEDFYSGECIDCTESEEPPFFDAGSMLCNGIHYKGAKCITDLQYNLFDGNVEDDSTECSYIESLRFGTYDENGKLSKNDSTALQLSQVSLTQKILLGSAVLLCGLFICYACYLHHAMTNLLIKSLSHRELLPPGRHQSRRSNSKSRRSSISGSSRRSGKRVAPSNGDSPDWDDAPKGEHA